MIDAETDAASPRLTGSDGESEPFGGEHELVAEQTRALVRDRPFVALAAAVLAGFLVSRILTRR